MCGFCGVLRLDGAPADAAPLPAMNQAIFHRGPDDGLVVPNGPCVLANRRLAILDLRPEAALPMTRGPITLAYNGELYNFQEQREALIARGHTFTTTGDTEVIIALYREYGEAFVDHMEGMYGIALWDDERKQLLVGRDPAGKKPLYYTVADGLLVFGSELKSLLLHPAVPRRPRVDMLPMVLAYGYAPTPETCYEGIHALPPGQLLIARDGQVNPAGRTYGSRLTGVDTSDRSEPGDWSTEVIDTLREAVRKRLVSDVPLGAFLSGGLDSSLIVALMAQLAGDRVRTFSIGFEGDESWDETAYALQVAQRFKTDHTPFRVAAPHVADLLPKLVWHHDQPFADSSAIPTLMLCELARQHVTVALSGDAGDELYAGYERFKAVQLATSGWRAWPGMGGAFRLAGSVLRRLPQGTSYADRNRRALQFAEGAGTPMPGGYFRWVRVAPREVIAQLLGEAAAAAPDAHFLGSFAPGDRRSPLAQILDVNYRTYLLDDLLVKADRMSMAASLEVRSPFLDADMVRLASRIPAATKLAGGVTKRVLKDAARQVLPDEIIDRRKHGFGVPLGEWFRTGLRGYAHDLLLDPVATGRGIFRREGVEQLLREHVEGRRDHGAVIWTLCTTEHWFQQFIDAPVPPEAPAVAAVAG